MEFTVEQGEKMKIAIVDDEKEDAGRLAGFCRAWAQQKQVSLELVHFGGGEELLDSAQRNTMQLVFMDIYMQGLNGIETARRLRAEDNGCLLVFLTSSREHMPEAFPCHAFDYLVKPALESMVRRVLDEAAAQLKELNRYLQLPTGKATVPVLYGELTAAVADKNYVYVYTSAEPPLRCRMTFGVLEEALAADSRFLTINRGVLVNMDQVRTLQDGRCLMKDGTAYPIRVRDNKLIEQQLQNYRFELRRARQR